jgi:hypothetical protein
MRAEKGSIAAISGLGTHGFAQEFHGPLRENILGVADRVRRAARFRNCANLDNVQAGRQRANTANPKPLTGD